MDFLRGKKHKHRQPEELVKVTVEQLQHTHGDDPSGKSLDKLSRYFNEMKVFMLGEGDEAPHEDLIKIVATEACRTDLLALIVTKLPHLEFESRKDAAAVFGAILRTTDSSGASQGVQYIHQHQQILCTIVKGYDDVGSALMYGGMLRECLRYEELAHFVLTGPLMEPLYKFVELENFEVASDAFQSLKDLLTRHKNVVGEYLQENYEPFFGRYTDLLNSENFVTRRQSLKLLGELLLDRHNVKVMLRYVSEKKNMCLMMNLLRDRSRSIQFEAFHVFKVFVANPTKPAEITDILMGNKEKLLLFLRDFHSDKDDEQFKEEKAVIMKEISTLGEPKEMDED